MIRFLLCLLAIPLALGKGRRPWLWVIWILITPWAFAVLVLNKSHPIRPIVMPEFLINHVVNREISKLEKQFTK